MNEVEAARRDLLDQEARYASLLSAANQRGIRTEHAVNRWLADAERAVTAARRRLKEAEEHA